MKHPRRQVGNPPYARVASLLVGLTLWATPAPAQTARDGAARAVQLNEAGAELYAAGNYAAALAAFERAYSLIMEPNLLFNIAGCYERLGQPARAVEYYQRFVRAPLADPEGRQRALESLESLESLEAAALEAAAPDTPAPMEPNAWTHPAWPLLTLGTGILLAGLGTGLYLDGARDHDEVTGAANYGDVSRPSSMTEVEAQRLIDAGDTKKLIGAIGLGVGGALIATHVVLTVWRSARGEASQVRAELRLLPAGCLVTGSF